jgi:hypothetical protein
MTTCHHDQLATLMRDREDAEDPAHGPVIWSTSSATHTDRWHVMVHFLTARAMVRHGLLEVVEQGDTDTPTSYRLTALGRTRA